jgi:hypothetical protein
MSHAQFGAVEAHDTVKGRLETAKSQRLEADRETEA